MPLNILERVHLLAAMAQTHLFAVVLCTLASVSSSLLVHASSKSQAKSRLNLNMRSAASAKHEASRPSLLSVDRDSLSAEDFTDTKDWTAFLNISHNGHPTQSREDETSKKVADDAGRDVDISDSFAQFEENDKIEQQIVDSQNQFAPL